MVSNDGHQRVTVCESFLGRPVDVDIDLIHPSDCSFVQLGVLASGERLLQHGDAATPVNGDEVILEMIIT